FRFPRGTASAFPPARTETRKPARVTPAGALRARPACGGAIMTVRRYLRRLGEYLGGGRARRPQQSRPQVEMLEDRLVPSTIVWENRGRDLFDQTFGGNAALARRIVDQAIANWSAVIANFNYHGVGRPGNASQDNTFSLNIRAGDLG